mgnify:CR=1 FL=1
MENQENEMNDFIDFILSDTEKEKEEELNLLTYIHSPKSQIPTTIKISL